MNYMASGIHSLLTLLLATHPYYRFIRISVVLIHARDLMWYWCTSTNNRISTKQKWLIVSTEMQCRAIENNGGFVIQVPYRYYDIIITARNEVGARLYFHRHLSFY